MLPARPFKHLPRGHLAAIMSKDLAPSEDTITLAAALINGLAELCRVREGHS